MPAKVRAPAPNALPRGRLEGRLLDGAPRRLVLVIAPAGSGKTTLLAQYAASCGGPVAWYRAEALDRSEQALVRHLEAALTGAVPGIEGGWSSVDDLIMALEALPATRVSIVVDDFHALEGSAAEAALGRMVEYGPASLSFLVGGRVAPGFNLSRMRVAGNLLEIGPDDLRFRSWEAEQLFREVYQDPVPPGLMADLTRRTEGWAAGLQLFHLASAGKSADERRRLLEGVGGHSRILREYLASNVLAELPTELRDFLRETCVLGRLSGPLCDRYLGRTGSADLLEDLVRRGVFTVPIEDSDGVYRYHEVLRSHLDRRLVAELGEDAVRDRYRRAAHLLEADGALAEALTAWSRAQDSDAVDRLMRLQGERLVASGHSWVEQLPPSLVRHEPWLMLAAARQARAAGRWEAALDWYARAEAGFGAGSPALMCRQERTVLAAWLNPATPMPPHWTTPLRNGLGRDPAAAARRLAMAGEGAPRLVRALLWLADGNVVEAIAAFRAARDLPDLDPTLDAAAALGCAVARLLGQEPDAPATLSAAVDLAERAGAGWLAALGRRIEELLSAPRSASGDLLGPSRLALAGGGPPDDRGGANTGDLLDAWGLALADLAMAWVGVARGSEGDAVAAAAERAGLAFRRLGSGVLEAWARGAGSLARVALHPDAARDAALSAEALARSTGVTGPRLAAYRALARIAPPDAADYGRLAAAVEGETGLALLRAPMPQAPASSASSAVVNRPEGPDAGETPASSGVRITTLGGFGLTVNGRVVDLAGLKPRARALLHLLAIHAPTPVHREVLQDALWPDADAATGARSLQVGVSAIRGVLAAATPDIAVVRDGDAYRLVAPDDAIDLRRVERLLARAREATAHSEGTAEHHLAVLDVLDRELLPEDGPADWVVERREQLRSAGVAAAVVAARTALAAADHESAARACRRGLALDRYHDPLWRLLIDADVRAGDAGAASRDRRQYEEILAGLERADDMDDGVSSSRTPRSRRSPAADWLDRTSP